VFYPPYFNLSEASIFNFESAWLLVSCASGYFSCTKTGCYTWYCKISWFCS